jgi:hypothetical protein
LDNSCASTPVDRAFSTYVGNGQQNELSTVAAKTLEKMKSDMANVKLADSLFAERIGYVEISDIESTNVTGSGNSGGSGVAGLVSDNVFDNLSETGQDAVTTLLSHNSQQGRVNDSLGSFDSQQEADIAAHNLYNPLSQIVKGEVQWFVVKTESGFQATFGAVGTLSGEGGSSTGVNPSLMYHRVKKSLGKASIMRSGHTHWDSNNNFSGHDARHVTSMVKNKYVNNKYLVSVSTRDGSYRELNYRRAKNSVNIARPEGRLIRGVTIGE